MQLQLTEYEWHERPEGITLLSASAGSHPDLAGVKVGDVIYAGTVSWEVMGVENTLKLHQPPRCSFVVRKAMCAYCPMTGTVPMQKCGYCERRTCEKCGRTKTVPRPSGVGTRVWECNECVSSSKMGKPARAPTTQERVNWYAKHVVNMLKGHQLTELTGIAVDSLEEVLEQLRKEKVAGG